ncbi:hypothetical protein QE390_005111 [Siphonobacter sp. SORGH_AS 1065]|nr:hypothetical protein [Siphonobacter sp. SORGH_AS_1065]
MCIYYITKNRLYILLINSNLREVSDVFLRKYNLKTNYDKIFQICRSSLKWKLRKGDNLLVYGKPTKTSDFEIVTLSITAEILQITSKNTLFSVLKSDYPNWFSTLFHRSTYNRRCRKLQTYISRVAQSIAKQISLNNSIFILDSMPLPLCHQVRVYRNKTANKNNDIPPSHRYHASHKCSYFGRRRCGYKL